MGLFSFFQRVFIINLLFFVRLNRTTTFLNFTFLISASFIRYSLFFNKKFFGFLLPSLTTPSNLTFVRATLKLPSFLARLAITIIEAVGKNIRPVSLTCRLRANISAGHLLSAMFFRASLDALVYFLGVFYIIFEIRVAIIQRFVYAFLLEDYSN